MVSVSARSLLQRGLTDRRPWMRLATILALCLVAAIPVGAILGLAGAMIGTAAILAIVVGYFMLRDVMVCLVSAICIICLLPFAALPIDIGFSPTFLDMALVVTYFVWICRLVTHKEGTFVADPPTAGVLSFVVLAVGSFIAGLTHAPLTANILRHFVEILMSVLLFVLTINAVRTRRQMDILILTLILAGFAAALIGIILYVLPNTLTVRLLSVLRVVRYPSGSGVLRYVEDNPRLSLRATSTSVDPNVLGGLLIFVTTLTVAQAIAERPLLRRGWLFVMAGTMGLCLVLTFSRGSFVGLAAALGLMAILRYRKLLWIGLAAIAALALLPPSQAYVKHFVEGVQGQDLATQMRFGEYKDAVILVSRYPWLGVGFSGTPEIDTYLGVSCVYLLIAEEMGFIGLLAFLAAMGSFLYGWARALRRCPPGSPLEPALLGTGLAVVGALIAGILDHYLFNLDFPHAAALLWLTVGLGTTATRLSEREGQTSDRIA